MSEAERQNDALSRPANGDESLSGRPCDDDSLLTAYALGELDDARRADVAARLRASAEQRQAVDDLARLGRLLRRAASQSSVGQPSVAPVDRSPELRQAVLAQMADPPRNEAPLRLPRSERFPRRRLWLPLSLAAALAVACGTLFALIKTKHGERVAARTTASRSAGTSALDAVQDVSEAETTESTAAAPEPLSTVALGDGSARLQTGGGEATYYEAGTASGETRRRPLYGTASELAKKRVSAGGSTLGRSPGKPSAGAALAPAGRSNGRGGLAGGSPERPRHNLSGLGDRAQGMPGADGNSGVDYSAPHGPQDAPPDSYGLPLAAAKSGGGQRGENEALFFRSELYAEGANRGAAMNPGAAMGMNPGAAMGMNPGAAMGVMPGSMSGEMRGGINLSGNAGYIALQNGESYPLLVENPLRKSTEYPLSTFSVDVDTASYTNVRRFLNSHAMPPRDAVRVEEMINYFQYSYPPPDGDVPFSVSTDVADCPWHAEHRLLRVGLKGREVPADRRPASNLVFLLDVSGSMDAPNKLPLVKEAMSLLTDKLTENDRVSIVVYAGSSGLVLPPTNGQNKNEILAAISRLVAGGSTNGGQGLQAAYDAAQANFIQGGTNRVILATDGDFNVGVVDQDDLVRLIEEKAKSGVFLSALGFGIGNLKDGTLEKLADKGNGNYAYIDTLAEARRVLVEQLSGTLVTIAKDVKLQIEFNPAQAAEYRLIGYEHRLMPEQDFHDDRKDAGEIGAGHSVTALYEIVPPATVVEAGTEPLKYQRSDRDRDLTAAAATGELAMIKLRYKDPSGAQSRLIEQVVADRRPPRAEASHDMSFAAAVAAFGMLLRDSPYRGDATYQTVLSLAEQGLAGDAGGYRSEFVQLVRQAREISGKKE